MPDFLETLSGIEGASVFQDVPMRRHTTWRVGGPVQYLVRAGTREAVVALLGTLRESGRPLTVIGNGSNLLVSDTGLEGVALLLEGELAGVSAAAGRLDAGAGAMLGLAVREAAGAGLGGLEFAAGIPGTLGGAVMTNAGAYGGCLGDVLTGVETAKRDGTTGRYERFDSSYRLPLVPPEEVVLSAGLTLPVRAREEIERCISAASERRRATQPSGLATAGSVFRNPPGGSAGSMIEACGLKGIAHGGACISEAHANFIVNRGAATADDILRLIKLAKESVLAKFKVGLELEVQLLGFEGE